MASHGSLDWQRNDRLGRMSDAFSDFEHRRQILRAIWFHAHTHADGNTDAVRAISYTITYAYDNGSSNGTGAASYSYSAASRPSAGTTHIA